LKAYGNTLAIVSIACLLLGLSSLAYGNRLPPLQLSENITRTQSTCTPEVTVTRITTAFLSTIGKTSRILTYTTTSVSVSSGGPSCPYGGKYYAAKYTKLCGWQYDVCITFDYNCGNDYHAVYVTRTIVQTLRVATTSTQYLVQTATDTLEWTATSTFCKEFWTVETVVREVPNPSKSGFGTLGAVFVVIGIVGLSGVAWSKLDASKRFKRGVTRLAKRDDRDYEQMYDDIHATRAVLATARPKPIHDFGEGRMITVRYWARCLRCAETINPGERARWRKGVGVWHDKCR